MKDPMVETAIVVEQAAMGTTQGIEETMERPG
jgi:hypothetical protein